MIINLSFSTLKGTTAHLDKYSPQASRPRMCKLVIFNALFALYLHFGMANIVQTEWNTKLVWVFPKCTPKLRRRRKVSVISWISKLRVSECIKVDFYTKRAEAGSWNKTRGTKLPTSERKESSLACLNASNLSKNLQKSHFSLRKGTKTALKPQLESELFLRLGFELYLTLLLWATVWLLWSEELVGCLGST